MHILERAIQLPVDAASLWDFIATPRNLNDLTPPDLDFRIISAVPERMFDGLYEIRVPLFGRQRWLTEIKHIRDGISFVDEQRLGPYRLWYHYHEITPLNDTLTRMLDRVHYQLPYGPLGRLVHEVRVKKMLEGIFAYRAERLRALFP